MLFEQILGAENTPISVYLLYLHIVYYFYVLMHIERLVLTPTHTRFGATIATDIQAIVWEVIL